MNTSFANREEGAVYRCTVCGRLLRAEHAKLRTICPACVRKAVLEFEVGKVTTEREREKIRELVKRFWGEEEQLAFDTRFIVAELPTYASRAEGQIIGFASYAETDDAVIIVALGILPEHQGTGVGKTLVEKIEAEAKRLRKKKLLVSTSNDDLPALGFYQSLGFQIYEVKPNVIAESTARS
jgi:ribosomal protein S18 acetylase RimI-like enzyme